MKRIAGFKFDTLKKIYLDSSLLNLKNRSVISPNISKTINDTQNLIYSFYNPKCTSPFYAHDAYGPWIKTVDNRYIYDVGGYGMLGFGHNKGEILQSLQKPNVMANIMTPNLSQHIFSEKISEEIGNKNKLNQTYDNYMLLNSGSEANSLAFLFANIHKHKKSCIINVFDSFHGRTETPSYVSNSTHHNYSKHLSKFKYNKIPKVVSVEQNNVTQLQKAYRKLKKKKIHIEAVILEPVMGEGNPGSMITPEFYDLAGQITKNENSLLIIDSIQAGFRCTGELSIVDYPNFIEKPKPDIEVFSKAINGGQFPLSVLGLSKKAKDRFNYGLYGNSMTGNPRGLEVANVIFSLMTPEVKRNIVCKGKYLKGEFLKLQEKYSFIEDVTGSGLLIGIHLDKSVIDVLDAEYELRMMGLNIIHGGYNALRLTPWFLISKEECDLIVYLLDKYFKKI